MKTKTMKKTEQTSTEVKSLAGRMSQFKLPKEVFWLDPNDDVILRLENLRFEEGSNQSCTCPRLVGQSTIVSGATEWINEIQCGAKECYESLSMAIAAKERRDLMKEKAKFLGKLSHHRSSQTDRIHFLRHYPTIVIQHLIDELKISEEVAATITPETLKVGHYRSVFDAYGWDKVLVTIVNKEFPTLIEVEEEEDE